ncbi:MAG: CYTH domain-containing protein [Pseudomonadota bacterium]
MATEIERKFLVLNDDWRRQAAPGARLRQGYLSSGAACSIRVRSAGDHAQLNIKSATLGVSRREYEYAIPVGDASELLDHFCDGPLIEKTRYAVEYAGHVWEVDVFEGDNAGLIVAEIELDSEDEVFEKPAWAGVEVSHDPRYYNVCLVKHPYKDWRP